MTIKSVNYQAIHVIKNSYLELGGVTSSNEISINRIDNGNDIIIQGLSYMLVKANNNVESIYCSQKGFVEIWNGASVENLNSNCQW